MRLFVLLVASALFCNSQPNIPDNRQAKDVVLSSFFVTDTHETGTPNIRITCNDAIAATQLSQTTLNAVKAKDTWYVEELKLFRWDSITMRNPIKCVVEEVDTASNDALGTTAEITFAEITYEGKRFNTQNPAEATFYLRCGNCLPYLNFAVGIPGSGASKQIAVSEVQVSSTLDTISTPSFYIECIVADTAVVFDLELAKIASAKYTYKINAPFKDFAWNNETMNISGACAIYERDKTDDDDSLGFAIIHFYDITPEGKTYKLANDDNSFFTLYHCQTPDKCSSAAMFSLVWSAIIAMLYVTI